MAKVKQKQQLMCKKLELILVRESLESHDKNYRVSLFASQSERPGDTSLSVHVDHVCKSVQEISLKHLFTHLS